MQFSIAVPHHYLVGVESTGKGKDARLTVYVTGDLDCDGLLSRFSRSGSVAPDGEIRAEAMQMVHESE
jgi:hypothetical protein